MCNRVSYIRADYRRAAYEAATPRQFRKIKISFLEKEPIILQLLRYNSTNSITQSAGLNTFRTFIHRYFDLTNYEIDDVRAHRVKLFHDKMFFLSQFS